MILKIVRRQYSVFAMQMSKTQGKAMILNIVRRQYSVFAMPMSKPNENQ